MKGNFIVASVLAVTTLSGCATLPSDPGQFYVQDKNMSYAGNVGAYAGYYGVLKDNNYSKSLDTLTTTTSNVLLLSSDMGATLGGGMGLALGFMSRLTALYPLNISDVWTARLNPGEKYDDQATALRVLKSSYQVLDVTHFSAKSHASYDRPFMAKGTLNDVVCEGTILQGFDYVCADPAFPENKFYIAAVRPANGMEFSDILSIQKGNYGVYLIDAPNTVEIKSDTTDHVFQFRNGAYVVGHTKTVLPRVAPREDGKRLVFIDGKATLI